MRHSRSPDKPASINQVTLASVIGTVIEWYDFFLYATMAALVFNTEFFPKFDALTGTLVAFGTFAAGFVTRPIGGLIFGHFGDRLGRKKMLVTTMMIMGGSTFAMGLLPGYATIGVWAPILLLVLRMLQGIGLGGEWGGAAILTFEHAPKDRRGLFSSWPQTGVPIGLLLSTLAVNGAGAFGEDALVSWAWRLPFLCSIVLVLVGMFVRLKVSEPPVFERIVESRAQAKVPVVEVFRRYPKLTVLAMGTRFCESLTFNVYNAFILTYTTIVLGLPKGVALNGLLIAAVIGFAVIPVTGRLSDRIGRRPVLMIGAAISGASAFPVFAMIDTKATPLIWIGIIIGWAFGACTLFGPEAAFFAELYPARVRYTGMSIVYQLGVLPSGAIAPAVSTALVGNSGGKSWPVALYILIFAVIALVALAFTPETSRLNRDNSCAPSTAATAGR
ncbi:MHS family MFS transporter [Amycolatopsis acidiphila]|uniref:Putative proline/betaine transporter n=1 Tax=Amycolatopsis acidiphila TaxID=715473 RepID=A0A558AL71_9PSEU|nr:MFS transporter [Amycolatopsis acidiphila]TVT25005.1 MHS family MFS transporter [Amycolatopsis acidiphila]UIJ57487.1 MHS family MFS transporter [Amycolatopsis acidiphila]GHG96367.1 MFS transporter [Amycolatopsis acidiphila]